MLKLIKVDSYLENGEKEVTLLDFSDKNHLEKTAAHEEIISFASSMAPKEGYSYLHILAMGSSEFWGSNRNHDTFPEENLIKYYKTFETSPAMLFRSHINKDKARSYGKVILAIYNHRMHRVELITESKTELIQDLLDRLKAGDTVQTSMACRTPADRCSICNNLAKTRQEYCVHLKTQLGQLLPDGRKVCAVNSEALTFFDISAVIRGADVTSSVLTKIANEAVIGSAELAEIEGINEASFQVKKAEIKKWADIVKEIPGGTVVNSIASREILSKTRDLPKTIIPSLAVFELDQVLSEMANFGISPSIDFLAELIAHKHLGEGYEGIGAITENYISGVSGESIVPAVRFETPAEVNPLISYTLAPYIQQSSLLPSQIEKRASSVGYSGLGPYIEPTVEEERAQLKFEHPHVEQHSLDDFNISYGKLLLGLGASALLAKMFITSQIEKKFTEMNSLHTPQNGVKIFIVKKASDYLVAANLSNDSLKSQLNKTDNQLGSGPELMAANKIAKTVLKGTGTSASGKLVTLLSMVGLGYKLNNNITKGA